MTYRQLINALGHELEAIGEEKEALIFAFKEKKGWSTTDFALEQAKEVSPEDQVLLEEIYHALKQHTPVQHYLGYAYFKDLLLTVSSDVLIPRPETEELVDLILAENPYEDLTVLDIGTGSGAIALALKSQRPSWQITASDISENALEIAKRNADDLGLAIDLMPSDVFSDLSGTFDIIVSNPPYIAENDRDEVAENVYAFEPHLALFAPSDGYAVYERIINGARDFLKPNGRLYFEIGYKQGSRLVQLLNHAFPNRHAKVIKDSFGKNRMVVLTNE
ncbi:peptide chain release factor N(5)-glutamine methyltransferase [Streptococcus pluranimalium]